MNRHFLSQNTHNGTQLPIKNNLLEVDEHTSFLAHFDISHNDIINNMTPFNSNIEGKTVDYFDFNNTYKRDIVRDNLLINLEADKTAYGTRPGSSVNKSTNMWHDDSGNNNHAVFNSLLHDDLNKWDNDNDINYLKVDNTHGVITFDEPVSANEVTLEAWIKINNQTDQDMYTISVFRVGSGNSHYLSVTNDLKIATYWYGKKSPGYHRSNSTLMFNRWTHIAVTWGRGELNKEYVRIYIDGVLDKEITVSEFYDGIQKNTSVSILQESSRRLRGGINTYRVYTKALSEIEIRNNYLKGTSSLFGVKNGNVGSPLILYNNPGLSKGINGCGVLFNGTTNYGKYISSSLNKDASFSIKFNSSRFVDGSILFRQGDLRYVEIGSNYISYFMKDDSGQMIECRSAITLLANTDYNLICTNTGSAITMCLDGPQIATANITRAVSSLEDDYKTEVTICESMRATISEFSTYNAVLTRDERDRILSGNISTINRRDSFEAYDIDYMLVGHWPLHNDTNDISGNNLNMINHTGEVTHSNIDRFKCANFTKVSMITNINDVHNTEGEVSISCFFNTRDKSTFQHFVSRQNDASNIGSDFMLGIHNNKLYSKIYANSYNDDRTVVFKPLYSDIEIEENRWYHAAYVFDKKFLRIYLDGSLVGEVNLGSGRYSLRDNGHPIMLGSERGNDAFMNGYLSNIRVYSRALSHEEINYLYKRKYLLNNSNYKYGGNLEINKPTTNLIGG